MYDPRTDPWREYVEKIGVLGWRMAPGGKWGR